jgi:hypothetical protein
MIYRLMLCAALCFLSPALLPRQVSADQQSFYVRLKKGPLKVSIEYDQGQEDWAAYVEQQTTLYLPLAETFIGQPFPNMKGITVYGCVDCIGWRQDDWIRISYSSTHSGSPSLLFHELNHFWFYYYATSKCQDWLVEGIVSFLPMAIREKGLLPDVYEYNEAIWRWWGLRWTPPAEPKWQDRKLCPFDESLRSLVYIKTFRLQYLIYHLIGKARYPKFLRRYRGLSSYNNTSVLKLLNSFTRKNWRQFLRGWVFAGKYRDVAYTDFIIDDDADGLSNGEEYANKTRPDLWDTDGDGLSDGTEIALKLNPRVFNADSVDLMRQYGPFADGQSVEWQYLDYQTAVDSSADAGEVLGADMTELFYLFKDDKLHLLVKTAAAPIKEEKVFFDVLTDTDEDGKFEQEFGFYLLTPQNPWHYDPATGLSDTPQGLVAGASSVIEISIPLSAIGSRAFRILPIIRNGTTKSNYDEWDSWVSLSY